MGIIEDVEELKKKANEEEQRKAKKFKLPFGKKVGKSQKKKNYVTILKLNENRTARFDKVQIENQTFWMDGIPRLGTTDYVFMDRKNPMIVCPSWSVEPISPSKNLKESEENGTNIKGFKVLLAQMKSSAVESKKKMGKILPWVIGGIILVGIIIAAVITGGGVK